MNFSTIISSNDENIYDLKTNAPGPEGNLPLTEETLRHWSSGHLFGMTEDAGMGWTPSELDRKQFLILSNQGGIRATDGSPIALGYHSGHWELGLLMQAAAGEFRNLGMIPYAGYCSDPCDGRTQGTTGACIGHIGPEALAGGPIGKILDGDLIQIIIDRDRLEGSVDLVGHGDVFFGVEKGTRILSQRSMRSDLAPDKNLPDDTRLWAVLQSITSGEQRGGTWGGCVYDVDAIVDSFL